MRTVIYFVVYFIIIGFLLYNIIFTEPFLDYSCSLHTHSNDDSDIQWLCSSKYANYGELQLVYEIYRLDKENNESEIERLKRIYDFKKNNKLLNIPCHYNFDNLKRKVSNTDIPKIHIDKKLNDKDGEAYTWARCYYDKIDESNDISMSDLNINNSIVAYGEDGNYLSFVKTDLASVKDEVCKNKYMFIQDKSLPCNDNNDCVFLRIECKVLSVDTPSITLKDAKFVKFNKDNNKFEVIKNKCYIQNFMTITYNNRNVYYIPYRSKRNAIIVDKDLCNDYSIKETSTMFEFDLSMIGIKDTSYILSKHLYGIRLKTIPYHPHGYATKTSYEDELRTNIVAYRTDILKTFKDRYSKCERRKKTQIDSTYKNNRSVKRLEQELKKILEFIELLKDYIEKGKPLDRRIVSRESSPYRYCRYSLTNPKDVDELYNNLNICKSTLEEQSGYHPENSKKKEELMGYMKTIEDFFKYVDENKLREMAIVPASAVYQLKRYKDAVSKVCTTSDDSTFTMRTVTRKLDQIEKDISVKGITDDFLDNLGELNLVVRPELLQYVSNDNCVYIQLDINDIDTCGI